jgi:hypothetical protein
VGFGFFRNLEHCKFYTKECRFVIVYQRSYPTKFGKFIPEIKISKNLNLRELLSTFIGNLTEEIECVMKVLKD